MTGAFFSDRIAMPEKGMMKQHAETVPQTLKYVALRYKDRFFRGVYDDKE